MTTTAASIPAAAEAFREWLLEGAPDAAGLHVVAVHPTWDEDSEGEAILRFLVTLQDPEGETWPLESVLAFHRLVDDHAVESQLEAPWYVAIEAATEDELDPADIAV